MIKRLAGTVFIIASTAGFAIAAVNVDVNTPNVRVQVGSPIATPPPQVRVIEHERVIVREREYERKHDNGKHKGHKKHKKHKKHDD